MSRSPDTTPASRRMRGFEPASGLVAAPVRAAGEARGFAVARLLTHWAEIVGEETARAARPVRIGYGREGGFGATLTLLTTSAHAPILQMQLPRIRDRVNACYGYAAIARITITQTAPTGFAEGQAEFAAAPRPAAPPPDPAIRAAAVASAGGVKDEDLRHALATLAENILNRRKA